MKQYIPIEELPEQQQQPYYILTLTVEEIADKLKIKAEDLHKLINNNTKIN